MTSNQKRISGKTTLKTTSNFSENNFVLILIISDQQKQTQGISCGEDGQ
jgi:hypothetical protein